MKGTRGGTRLADSQKAFRSGDITDVGDNRHTTFFEMLGNWSLGDYGKKEQLLWIFDFLTEVVGLPPERLFVTVFAGDKVHNLPQDDESAAIWQTLFKTKNIDAATAIIGSEADGAKRGITNEERIFYYDSAKNWWSRAGRPQNMPVGEPGGPDSEIFYQFPDIEHDSKFGEHCHPNCDCGRFLEIGNSVFMEYQKNADGTFQPLPQKNVDFGGGLERIAAVANWQADIFQIDIFAGLITKLESLSGHQYQDRKHTAAFRVVADHLRAATFLIGDGVVPSNAERGYFVRRLIRRAVRFYDQLGITAGSLADLVSELLVFYHEAYPEITNQTEEIKKVIMEEEQKFRLTLHLGLKELKKSFIDGQISGLTAFKLFTTYGFPIELTTELAAEEGITVDLEQFKAAMTKHQDLSRAGSEQKFKGGLQDTGAMSVKYHTATHLLHQALVKVLGSGVSQKGSNITPERLRFDFTHPTKLTDEEKQAVENLVNEQIGAARPVQMVTLSKTEAEKTGARHFFGDKYGEQVNIYYIGNSLDKAWSKEFCGGPHVANTSNLGHFKIVKEEAVAAGVRRIKAVLT